MMKFRKIAATVLSFAAAAVLMYFVLSKAGFRNIPVFLAAMDLRRVALAAGLYTLDMLVRAYRWKLILKGSNIEIRVRDSFMAYNLGNSLNIVIPAKIGDIARSYYLKRKFNYGYSLTLPSTFLDRLFDVVGVYVVILLCSIYILAQTELEPWLYDIFLLGIVVLLLAFLVMELLVRRREYIGRIGNEKLRSFVFSLAEAFDCSFRDRRRFLVLLLCSVAIWLSEGIFAYMIFVSMGLHLNPIILIFTTMIAVLTKVFPITPGGIGIFEGTMVLVLAMFGLGGGAAAAASAVNHFFMNLYTVMFGIYVLLRENISVSGIQRESGK